MRSVLRLLAGVIASVVALAPRPVWCQSTAIPAQQTAPGWIFTPSISYGGTWDDNVLLVNPGTDPPADYGSPITPGASLDYTGKYTRFSSGYSGAVVRYLTLDDLNSFQQSLRATIERRLSTRLTLLGQETFTAAPTTDVLRLSGVPFYRIGAKSNSAGGGIQAALAKHTMLRAAYALRTVAFDVNEFTSTQLLGGHAHDITASVDQTLSRHFTVGGEYEFSRTSVNGRGFGIEQGPQDRFNIETGSVTAQYQATQDLTLNAAFGLARLGAGLTHEERTGPQWRAGLAHRAGRGVVTASYQRAYIPSFGFGGTFQNEQWSANVHMPIVGSRAYVDGGFSWLNNDPLDTEQPSLQTAWVTSSVGYYLVRWLSVEGFFNHTQQDSQRAGGQLHRNQIGFQLNAAKPMKLR